MSGPDERPLPRGSGRVLMLGTVVLAVAAAVVLALGAQDARLLRLGLIAALWAALLGAFAAARMRREISSDANRVDELRTVYQLELEREVAARREHMLTVERELREQAEQAERGEIAALRAELAAMRVNLEKLLGGDPLVERLELRAESARVLPMAAYRQTFGDSSSFDDRRSATAALGATAKVAQVAQVAPQITPSLAAAGLSMRVPGGAGSAVFGSQDLRDPLPTSEWSVNGRNDTAPAPREDPELCFGPGRRYGSELDTQVPLPVEPASSWPPVPWNDGISQSQDNGGYGASTREPLGPDNNGFHSNGFSNNGSHSNGSHVNGSHVNGSHVNGSHNNGGGARRAPHEASVAGAQRSVNDLLAAHGGSSTPRRRRSREDGPQA
ncbi:MAG: hypothetical protein M3302_07570 [Actinomycetota bacterium]|nr:hypothetical protein [Actinomycetota bacterium]